MYSCALVLARACPRRAGRSTNMSSEITRRRDRSRRIYEMWVLLQDLLGNCNEWPFNIRKLFQTKHLNNYQRLLITAFIFINGLDPEIFFEWCQLLGLLRDNSAYRHVRYLLDKFLNSNKYDHTIYGYSVIKNKYVYINGHTRFYNKPKQAMANQVSFFCS